MAARFSLALTTMGGTMLHLDFSGDPWPLVAGILGTVAIGAVAIFARGKDGPDGDRGIANAQQQLALNRQQQALNRQQEALMIQQQEIMQRGFDNDNRPVQFVHNDFGHE